jgi:hypothetical protein
VSWGFCQFDLFLLFLFQPKKSKELPAINGERTQQVVTMSRERLIDNKLQLQVHQQQQQQQQQAKQTTNALRWREKEVEMQNRLTEREKEIGRLKEKLRDLTKKLQQEQQHYNSKVKRHLGSFSTCVNCCPRPKTGRPTTQTFTVRTGLYRAAAGLCLMAIIQGTDCPPFFY